MLVQMDGVGAEDVLPTSTSASGAQEGEVASVRKTVIVLAATNVSQSSTLIIHLTFEFCFHVMMLVSDVNVGEVTFSGVCSIFQTPWDLDEALRRRLEKRVYIPLPDSAARADLFRINMKGVTLASDIREAELARLTEGYSGADIANVCRDAAMMDMRKIVAQARQQGITGSDLQTNVMLMMQQQNSQEVQSTVSPNDFLVALSKVGKSVGEQDLKKYAQWMRDFGSS